uniref:Pentatricopeptide repeat-containing protein n=1 Tax=Solanum tuberosum TaxID=4113 RepID=M1B6U5_SOLTU
MICCGFFCFKGSHAFLGLDAIASLFLMCDLQLSSSAAFDFIFMLLLLLFGYGCLWL